MPPLRKSRAIPGGHPHPPPSGAPVPTPFGLRPFPPDRGKAYGRPQESPLRMPSQFGGGGTPQGGFSRPSASHPPLKGEALREGQIPIPSVSLRSTSPLDKGSRPLPYGITETVVRARRRPKAAPTVEIEPGAFARPGQARKWNCTSSHFPPTQGPVARQEFRVSLRFCAPVILQNPAGTRSP